MGLLLGVGDIRGQFYCCCLKVLELVAFLGGVFEYCVQLFFTLRHTKRVVMMGSALT